MSRLSRNLVFLERQFNGIKGLIPLANVDLTISGAPEKLVRKLFPPHQTHWDTMQSPEKLFYNPTILPQEQINALSKKLMLVMSILVQVKRLSHSANITQKSRKDTLYELLLRIRDRVMQTNPSALTPTFMPLNAIPSAPTQAKKIIWPWMKRKSIHADKAREKFMAYEQVFLSTEISPFASEVLREELKTLYQLAHLEPQRSPEESKKMPDYVSLQARAVKAGKEYEAKAYEIMFQMSEVNRTLYQTIRDTAIPHYESMIPFVLEWGEASEKEKDT